MAPPNHYSDEAVDAAVQALTEPGRLDEAQRVAAAAAPQLQRILDQALDEGGFFGTAHRDEVRKALAADDPGERDRAVGTLVAEETRLSMLIGVAVGFELAHLLDEPTEAP